MKKIIVFALITCLLLSLSACGSSSDTPSPSQQNIPDAPSTVTTEDGDNDEVIELSFIGWTQEEPYTKITQMFNESQNKIHVKFEVIPQAQYTPLINATLGTADGPDILWGSVSTGSYILGGMIEPLDEYVERDNFDLSVFYPATLAQQYYNGKLYGIPKGIDTYAMCYNKAIFDKYGIAYPEEGWSWTDVDRIARELQAAINAKGGDEYALGMMINEVGHWFLPICVSNGAVFITDDLSECLINSQNAVDMIEMTVKLIQDGVQPDYATLTETSAVSLYTSGKIGITTLGSYYSALTVISESDVASTTVLLPWPKGPATGTNFVSNAIPNNYVMNSGSPNKDAAWEFLKYLISEEADAVAASMQAHLPARISNFDVWVNSFKDFDVTAYSGAVKNLATTVFPVNYLSCLLQISPNMLPVYNGEVSAQEGLNNVAEAVNKLLKENMGN